MKSKEEIFELILLSDLPLPEKQDVYDYINSLECCGNCELEAMWYGESECTHRSECNKCSTEAIKSFWKPIF